MAHNGESDTTPNRDEGSNARWQSRVGINGFGRIGRNVFKALYGEYGDEIEVVAANDLGDVDTMAHLLKYDSVYGPFFGGEIEITRSENGISLDGRELRILAERDPAKLPWGDLGVDNRDRVHRLLHRRGEGAGTSDRGGEEGDYHRPGEESRPDRLHGA